MKHPFLTPGEEVEVHIWVERGATGLDGTSMLRRDVERAWCELKRLHIKGRGSVIWNRGEGGCGLSEATPCADYLP